MNKRMPVARQLLLALAIVISGVSLNAIAQVEGSTSAIFQNPTGPDGMVAVVSEEGSKFSWGTGVDSPPSSVKFFGASFSSPIGAPFEVGSITYFNGTIAGGTQADTVDLALKLDFTTPSGLTATPTYTLELINTPNTGDANANADILRFPSLPTQAFTINGVDYKLALDVGTVTEGSGFSSQHSFHVLEGESATATLIGTITVVPSVVASGLKFPQGVAVLNGVLYIADRNAHTVWKKDLVTNTISPVAGTGTVQQGVLVPGKAGYNGDGISATQAQLNGPASVAVDANGNVFVADAGNHIVRMINTSGMITTVAGTPKTLSPIVNGLLAVGNGGPATAAFLNGPRGVAVAGNTLYIADTINQQVRKVEAGTISAVAGLAGTTGGIDGSVSLATLNDPRGVAVQVVGGNHVVYIADVGNNKIRKVDAGNVSSVAAGTLRAPAGVAVAGDGTLYIADTSNHRVVRVDASTGSITTVAGTGTAGSSVQQLNTPVGVALDTNGDLYIADQVNNRVLKLDFTP